jgi:hypothetical protein
MQRSGLGASVNEPGSYKSYEPNRRLRLQQHRCDQPRSYQPDLCVGRGSSNDGLLPGNKQSGALHANLAKRQYRSDWITRPSGNLSRRRLAARWLWGHASSAPACTGSPVAPNALIALRCCRLSGRFRDFWERLPTGELHEPLSLSLFSRAPFPGSVANNGCQTPWHNPAAGIPPNSTSALTVSITRDAGLVLPCVAFGLSCRASRT